MLKFDFPPVNDTQVLKFDSFPELKEAVNGAASYVSQNLSNLEGTIETGIGSVSTKINSLGNDIQTVRDSLAEVVVSTRATQQAHEGQLTRGEFSFRPSLQAKFHISKFKRKQFTRQCLEVQIYVDICFRCSYSLLHMILLKLS